MNTEVELIIFIGPPGSGKGTLSQQCTQKLGWIQLSTGNLCRKSIEEATPIGKKIDFAIKSGKLVDDLLISDMVTSWLEGVGYSCPVILDGFPRTLAQARHFHAFLAKLSASSSLHIVRLILPDEQVVRRLTNRYICVNKACQAVYSLLDSRLAPKISMQCDMCHEELNKREDDEKKTVLSRLETYHRHESELLSFFEESGYQVSTLDVDNPIEVIFDEFSQKIRGAV